MRWNCPHCSAALTAPESKLSDGWSFCRCYRCRGFSLIRKSDVGLIKVNGTPEHISAEMRAAEMNTASLHAERRHAQAQREAIERARAQVSPPPFPRNHTLARGYPTHEMVALPDPLPERPARNFGYLSYRALPLAIALAGISAFGSAVYLFVQSQALIEKRAQIDSGQTHSEISQTQASAPKPEPSPEPQTGTRSPAVEPAPAIATAPAPEQVEATLAQAELVDEVTHRAMAPTRPIIPAQNPLIVQPIHDHATLRTGPGLEYPVLGIANPKAHYRVSDFSERWFKVVDQPGTTGAWIRNDLLKIIND